MALGANGSREIPAEFRLLIRGPGWRHGLGDELGNGLELSGNQAKAPERTYRDVGTGPGHERQALQERDDAAEVRVRHPVERFRRHDDQAAAVRPDTVSNDGRNLRIAVDSHGRSEIRRDDSRNHRIVEQYVALGLLAVTVVEAAANGGEPSPLPDRFRVGGKRQRDDGDLVGAPQDALGEPIHERVPDDAQPDQATRGNADPAQRVSHESGSFRQRAESDRSSRLVQRRPVEGRFRPVGERRRGRSAAQSSIA